MSLMLSNRAFATRSTSPSPERHVSKAQRSQPTRALRPDHGLELFLHLNREKSYSYLAIHVFVVQATLILLDRDLRFGCETGHRMRNGAAQLFV
jgi:hypothetical protein